MSLRMFTGPIALSLAMATLASPLGAGAGTAERAAPDRGAKGTWTEADTSGFGTEHPQPRARGDGRPDVHRS